MPWVALGIAGAAGLASYAAQSSANDRAQKMNEDSMREWMALRIPDPAEQKVVLDRFVSQGVIDPRLESAIKADPSAFDKVFTNSRYQASQNRALSELENIGYEGGMRLQDKAALQDATQDSIVKDRAQREGIAAEMARRGLGGSGFDVAAQLQGQQGTADRMANSSLKAAASAQDRALQAIMGAGDLAGKYRSQDFSEQAQKASAADKINMFNTENLRDVNQRNTGMLNRSQELNLANRQKISDDNTRLGNSEQMYNKGLAQQQYENEMKRTAGATGQYKNVADNEQKGGQMLGNTIGNIGAAVTSAYGANAKANSDSEAQSKYYDFWDNYGKKK